MHPIAYLLTTLLSILWWGIMAWFVMNILLQFDIINRHNHIVNRIYLGLESVIEPILRPIRKYIPVMGGIDWSPLVLILAINMLKYSLAYYGVQSY